MQLNDVLDDRKPKARSSEFARARFVYPVETLKYAGNVFFGDTDSWIFYGNLDFAVYFLTKDPNKTFLLVKLYRIIE